jgi:hypothetical protein
MIASEFQYAVLLAPTHFSLPNTLYGGGKDSIWGKLTQLLLTAEPTLGNLLFQI